MIPILFLLAASTVAAENPDNFQAIVKRVEAHYGKRHMQIPLFGLVTFASHLTRPAGASGLQMAIIEDIDTSKNAPTFHPGPNWRPIIRTTSHHREQTVIYARDEGHNAIHVLLVAIDNDAVVMQMRLAPSAFLKFLADKSRSE